MHSGKVILELWINHLRKYYEQNAKHYYNIHQFFTIYFICVYILQASPSIENKYLSISINKKGAITFHDKENNIKWSSNHVGWVELSNGNMKEKLSLKSSGFTQTIYQDSIIFQFRSIEGEHLHDEDFSLPPKSFRLKIPGEPLKMATVTRKIEYLEK